MKIFPHSRFFKERRAPSLPAPDEIKAINEQTGSIHTTSYDRPPPAILPSLRLLVKYGADVSATEAETQRMIRTRLQSVPIPEVFGWTKYNGQTFIYMDLIEGITLCDRWAGLNETERQSICEELSRMVQAWRALTQEEGEQYIGE